MAVLIEVDSTGNKAVLTENEVAAASPEDAAASTGAVVVSIAVDAVASVAVAASNRDLTPRAVRCSVRYPSHSLLAPTVCH